MNNSGKKQLLALLLALCLLVMSVPAAFAAANETPADEVTVYFSLSSDGVPVVGADGTVLSRVKVTVPYFDLAKYGMQDFYRYETANGFGRYVNKNLVERPTVLHLYLYMLERYYEGLNDSQCCKGNLNQSLYAPARDINGLLVNPAGLDAIDIKASSPMSMYMKQFWGHDENLMYFVDHQYPYMSPKVGSTADYILLQDGMSVDVAMFTNWAFYNAGGFLYFDQDEYRVESGKEQTFSVFKTYTGTVDTGDYTIGVAADGMKVSLWNEDMSECLAQEIGVTGDLDDHGEISYTFAEPGTYVLLAQDPHRGTLQASHSSASATVHVLEESVPLTGISFANSVYPIEYGDTWLLEPILEPADATNVTLSWTSSNPAAVSVSDTGILAGAGEGSATITCTATDGSGNSMSAECTVEVGAVIDATGVAFKKKNITIAEGRTVQLEYSVTPDNANNTAVLFRTSECPQFDVNYTDADYITAKVDHLGKLYAKKPGEITVTLKTDDGGFEDTCTVKVVPAVKGDVTGDGNLNIFDATKIVAQINGKAEATEFMDINGNGSIDIFDVTRLVAAINGKKPLS